MMAAIGNPPVELVLWDGRALLRPDGVAKAPNERLARVIIHDRAALLRLILSPTVQFGELYASQRIDVEGDLADFLEVIYRNLPHQGTRSLRDEILSGLPMGWGWGWLDPHRTARSIHHHYDIGNDFYRLWLDERMVYTCAYFPDQKTSLEDAQTAKLDLVCRKLNLRPGEAVVELGCGWGALTLHMAQRYGVTVKAYNLSVQQLTYARDRARAQGLSHRVEFIEDDYRNASGKFDALVAIGMLEHIGPSRYRELGMVLDRVIKRSGRGLIHSIGRDSPRPMDPWIQRHIFPEVWPPSLAQMMDIFEPQGFSVLDVENLRLHYATTLEHWLQRFDRAAGVVQDMFEPEFVRMWRLYLAGSIAAFRSGTMQLFQVVFTRTQNNQIPWTRYAPAAASSAPSAPSVN